MSERLIAIPVLTHKLWALTLLCLLILCSAGLSYAVDCGTVPPRPPITVDSVETFTFAGVGGTDCWGWEAPDGTEYAIMGILQGVVFVNITTLQVVDTIPGPTNGCSNIRWRDMKSYQPLTSQFDEELNQRHLLTTLNR